MFTLFYDLPSKELTCLFSKLSFSADSHHLMEQGCCARAPGTVQAISGGQASFGSGDLWKGAASGAKDPPGKLRHGCSGPEYAEREAGNCVGTMSVQDLQT